VSRTTTAAACRGLVFPLLVFIAPGGCNAILGIHEKRPGDAAVDSASFQLALGSPRARVVTGRSVSVQVTVQRAAGFGDAISALVSSLPVGVTVDALTFAPSETTGALVIHASGSADLGRASLVLVGASAGQSSSPLNLELIVQGPSGTPDSTFGDGGRVVLSLAGVTEQGLGPGGVQMEPDGSIVLCGHARTAGTASSVLLARLTADGALDPQFGMGGSGVVLANSAGSSSDACLSAFIRPSGGVLFAGFATPTVDAPPDLMTGRYSTLGHPSANFGAGGVVTAHLSEAGSMGWCLLAGASDSASVVVGGSAGGAAVLVRYLQSAKLDPTFGEGDGIVTLAPEGVARSLAQQSTGALVVGVQSSVFRVQRLTPDGLLDTDFGGGGATTIGAGGSLTTLLVRPGDDGILAVGTTVGDSGVTDIAVASLTSSGQPDLSFGASGWGVAHFALANSTPSSAVLQLDGSVTIAGQTPTDLGQAFSVLRFAPDGSLDGTFGPSGRQIFDQGGTAQGITIDDLGRIIVAGVSGNSSDSSIVVYRLWP
jgi:uncharacterized delta-60 repeat protein